MALQHTLELDYGITLPQAYSRIEEFFYAKNGQVGLQVAHYVDETAAQTPNIQPIRVDPYMIRDVDIYGEDEEGNQIVVQPSQFKEFFTLDKIDPEGRNMISQGYEYLKTLPEFEGAIDVLED